ncbi:hypothetical protein ACIPY2_14150 [Paenarthrobacter sp. NPDC089675]|uniref:hypothetical protein n=1 Tax=Paenarthrobacter sp. NPDC089675 TaxID=3364376 RepID=UPI00382ADE8E
MALSATAASADSRSPDQSSLGGIKSSVSSTISSVQGVTPDAAKTPVIGIPVPNVSLPAPVKAAVPAPAVTVQVPTATPVVEQVAGSVDNIVGTLPLVNQVVPSNTVGTVVDSAVVPVTGSVDEVVGVVTPPVNEVLKPIALAPVTDATNPVVQPIVDVVDKALPPLNEVLPPITGPADFLPALPGDQSPAVPAKPGEGTLPPSAVVISPEAVEPAEAAGQAVEAALTESLIAVAAGQVGGVQTSLHSPLWNHSPVPAVGDVAMAAGDGGSPAGPIVPETAPLAATNAGSGSSQNGPVSPVAAFLGGALVISADSVSGLALASNEQHPRSVSSDPGSSPD